MKDKGLIVLGGVGLLIALLVLWLLLRPAPGSSTTILPEVTLVANGRSLYTLLPTESEARFTLNELLRGQPTTVVGRTRQVSGEIALTLDDLSTAEISPLQIAASTLATDNNLRNSAINTYILYTDRYPTITFTPTDIAGLPAQAAVGAPLSFTVTGDLTIIGISREVMFDVTAVAETPTRISGTAQATIHRSDWELTIPNVRGVASVDEDVLLELDFTAVSTDTVVSPN